MSKAEKIKAKIERLKESLPWGSCASQISMECNCKNEAYNEVLSYIDSLSDTEKDFGIKESVISFGASDSELMEATYSIPQGYHAVIDGDKVIIKKGEEPVSNDLEEAATKYARKQLSNPDYPTYNNEYEMECAFEAGAQWQKENLWKDAQGDDLPEIDREVIALLDNGKVVYAHRPSAYWDGKNIATGEVTRYYPKRYDKGGWNQPNVKWWLDLDLPKMEE